MCIETYDAFDGNIAIEIKLAKPIMVILEKPVDALLPMDLQVGEGEAFGFIGPMGQENNNNKNAHRSSESSWKHFIWTPFFSFIQSKKLFFYQSIIFLYPSHSTRSSDFMDNSIICPKQKDEKNGRMLERVSMLDPEIFLATIFQRNAPEDRFVKLCYTIPKYYFGRTHEWFGSVGSGFGSRYYCRGKQKGTTVFL